MNNFEKNIIAIVLIIIFVIGSFHVGRAHEQRQVETNLYPNTGTIIYIDKTNNLALIEDTFGTRWLFDAEGWMEGDIVSMLMDNNGTPDIMDDEILTMKYSGYEGDNPLLF